ncbi:hypothetical protein ACFLR4_05160, partial [Bacteroidota bacterium]
MNFHLKINPKLIFLTIFPLTFIFTTNITGQDFDCLDCHDNVIENSVHFEMVECADCHADVEDET